MQHSVEENAWDGFIKMQDAVREAAHHTPGLVYARQLRGRDESAALAVVRFQDRESWENLIDNPMFVETMSQLPDGVKLVRTEVFEIMSNVLPAK